MTSGGMVIAAPPTRDCAGDVVEKHFVRGVENAGARKIGSELRWRGSRRSWRAQRWGNDMMGAFLVVCCFADFGFCRRYGSVHVTIYIISVSFWSDFGLISTTSGLLQVFVNFDILLNGVFYSKMISCRVCVCCRS